MATTKFDPYRTTGGTIELVRDPNTGAYSTKTVGFAKLPVLNLPELGTTTGAATTTATTTDTATDLTGTGVSEQTKQAFREPQNEDRVGILDLDLTTKAKDISKSLSDIDSGRGGDSASAISRQTANLDSVSTPTTIQDSMLRSNRFDADTFDDKTGLGIQKATGDIATQGQSRFSGDADTTDVTVKDTSVIDRSPTFLKNLFGEPRGVEVARGRQPVEGVRSTETVDQLSKAEQEAFDRKQMVEGATPDDATANRLGISAKPETLGDTGASMDQMSGTKLDTARFAGSTAGTLADPAEREDVKPASTSALTTLRDSVSSSPTLTALGAGAKLAATTMSKGLDAVFGVSPAERSYRNTTSAVLKSSGYKTRNELGSSTDPDRIAMSPQDSVFGGMNRSGNTIKGANKRISTRTTIGQARVEKRYGKNSKQAQDFKAKTEKFKAELEAQQAKVNKATMNQGPPSQSGGGGGSSGGGKIVCTMMNESYGFGSFRNKIWLRQSKNLAPEYQIGYHKLFLPLVKYAKQKGITNSIVKKTLEHIAIHRTIDIRQEEKNKIHLIGRIYRKILEPICYWAGKV